MSMNKNNGSSIIPLIFFIFFISTGGFGLFSLIPIFVVFFVFFAIFKSIFNSNNQPQARSRVRSTARSNNTAKSLSNRDRSRIDKKLARYFRQNIKLPILDNISLTTKNGNYTVIEELYISMGDELIISMDDFKNNYPDMYSRICDLLLVFSKQEDEVLNAEVKVEEVKKEEKLSDAEKYIDKINSLNNDIPNEEVTNGLYQTSALLKQIELSADKDDEDKLSKLYDYYLPILTKILENYKTLSKVNGDSEEIKKSEVQLIKTIILINEALKELNNSLHEDEYMNLSADITTLQSLLKKDGLVNSNPFQKEDENGEK